MVNQKVKKSAKRDRGTRNWCFTVNNWTSDSIDLMERLQGLSRYLVYGKEVGESGTPHLQGFVIFEDAKTFTACKKCIPGAHLEACRGTCTQAADYCKKDGDFVESGRCPVTKEEQGELEKERYQRAWEIAKSGGDLEEVDPDIRLRLYGTLKRIKADYQQVPESIDELDFWWYYGSSGTGKSLTARAENPGYYVKNRNKWWDGYVDQPCVIIEEWNPDMCLALQQYLKEWCDHHPFAAEVKGGTTCIRPPKIIVTSNYSLADCFGHDIEGLFKPLARRFKVREFLPTAFVEPPLLCLTNK